MEERWLALASAPSLGEVVALLAAMLVLQALVVKMGRR